jgi:hypothetical protein
MFPKSLSYGFVEKGFGYGYVSFIVKSLSFIVLRLKTKPASETDTWPKPTPINEKPIQATAPGYPDPTEKIFFLSKILATKTKKSLLQKYIPIPKTKDLWLKKLKTFSLRE